jgi:hypothetical protein
LCAPAALLFLALTRLTRPGARGQDGGGIVISGLPAAQAAHNGAYAPTGADGQLVEGYPAYAAGPDRHRFRHPKEDRWHINNKPLRPNEVYRRGVHPGGGRPGTDRQAGLDGLDRREVDRQPADGARGRLGNAACVCSATVVR